MSHHEELMLNDLLQVIETVDSKERVKKLYDCLNDELFEALIRVSASRKAAEVNLKIKIVPIRDREIDFVVDISKKVPKTQILGKNTFYQNSDGNIFLDDPLQLKLHSQTEIVNINKGVSNV